MRILQFRINGQKLSKDGGFSGLIAGTKGYLYAAYNFDGEWDGCKKAAVFSFARHGRALAGESPEHAQVVGNV